MDISSLTDDRSKDTTSTSGEALGTPQPSISVVAKALANSYGLEVAAVQPAGGEVDINLRVETNRGRFLAKVGAPRAADEDWRDRILDHVARVAPSLPVPRIVETNEGTSSTLFVDDGTPWQMRVHSWLAGDLLAAVSPTSDLLRELGRRSAELTDALATFDDTSMASHPWDLRTASETLTGNLTFLRSPERTEAVRRIVDTLALVRPLLDQMPLATVHHDLNDYNILVATDSDGGQRISGILDFNDALRTYRVADVAIAAGYAMLRQPDPVDAAAAVVSGYHSHSPLRDDELEAVFPLAAIRLCLNATLWTRRTADPEHAGAANYGRRRMADTWPMVEHLSTIPPRSARDHIRRACGLS